MGKHTIAPFGCEADFHRWIEANCNRCDRSFGVKAKWVCPTEKRINAWDITHNTVTEKQAIFMGMTETKPGEYKQLFTCKCRGFKK